MKRWVVGTAAAAALAVGSVASLDAQRPAAASRADIGAYAGGAWTSPWLEAGDGTTFGIGFNPIFGARAHGWIWPRVGVRLHGAVMPSDVPQPSNEAGFGQGGAQQGLFDGSLRTWFYDAGLVFRPFVASRPGLLSSFYVFGGGGALSVSTNVSNQQVINDCLEPYNYGGACLSTDWRVATVGQVTAGAGLNVIPLNRWLGLFTEAGVHVYSSPFHIGEQWTGLPPCPNEACRADDRLAVTTRLGAGLTVALGLPAPRVEPLLPPPPAPVAPPVERPITICVVVDGAPRYVEALIRPEVGDTVVIGEQGVRRPLRAAFPVAPPTASGRDWFLRDEPIFLGGREYVRFGVPRDVTAGEITRVTDYQGIPVFAPVGETAAPWRIILVPVQDGCVFQPYQLRARVGEVRG